MQFLELNVLNNEPTPVIGIDLGTTNSLAAVYKDCRPQILRPPGHPGTVPSVVYFEAGQPELVGREARIHAVDNQSVASFSFKRFMGRGLADVTADLNNVPFPATENEHGVLAFDVFGRKYTPQ